MKYLRFRNEGEIDIAALTLMGATSKANDNDSSKIGFFGSGNKYALATLLNTGHEVYVFAGPTLYTIGTKAITFRGESYQQICINEQETSLTTRMGPTWEPWMALREFYCNAIDEGCAAMTMEEQVIPPDSGWTYIYVSASPEVEDFFNNNENYINNLGLIEVAHTKYGRVDILESTEGLRFRKGIRCVYETQLSLFSYNHEEISINESRILNNSYQQLEQMACALALTNKESIVRALLPILNNENYLESKALWHQDYCTDKLSPTWEAVLLDLGKAVVPHSIVPYIEQPYTYTILPVSLYEKVKRDLPKVPIYGDFDAESIPADPSPDLAIEVLRCSELIERWGHSEITVHYRKFIRDSTLGQYHDGKIYLSVDCSLAEVLETLYEEVIHRDTGYGDKSRELQDWLFRELIALKLRA